MYVLKQQIWRGMMRITIKDIAAATGLSPTTISLVLNERPNRVAESTKELIRRKAAELGYTPNQAAVLLKTSRSYTLGLIVPDIRNDYYASYAQGMEDACQENAWTLILCTTSNNPARERKYIDTLHAKSVDGVALVATPSDSENNYAGNTEHLNRLGIPFVQMDLTNYQDPANAVICDHHKGGYMAAKHLLSLGHRNILLVSGPKSLEGSASRLKRCRQAFEDCQITWNEDRVFYGDYTYKSGLLSIDNMIDQQFTAVFAFNDLMAHGVYDGLSKYNLRVPEDVSVVGYDDSQIASVLNPPLTTVRQPIYEMGKAAAEILIAHAKDSSMPPVVKDFDLELVVRGSTRALS